MSKSSPLVGKRIVLGVGGGIAAYKVVELMRRMVDAGAFVSPVLTRASLRFVGRTTFSALGSEPARISLWDGSDPIPHTRLGQLADAIVLAPATADLIARYAAGIADDLLTTTLLASKAPVVVVAAMHTEMWQHPSVVENVATLRRRGVVVIEPEAGRLAGGDIGVGRLAETDVIVQVVETLFEVSTKNLLANKSVLVTAGGTREPIDPVRYIGNRSSGKQGIAFARAAAELGARVNLISTVPVFDSAGINVVPVESAQEMFDVVSNLAVSCDLVVMAAAVADFRSANVSPVKIKKRHGAPEIRLEPTPDILAHLGATKRPGQVLVGFAAETGDLEIEARRKLKDKNADFIVANNVLEEDAGFAVDTNRVTLFYGESEVALGHSDKRDIAEKVLRYVAEYAKNTGAWQE